MKTKTKLVLQVLKVLAWIIFIGLCIKTGAVIISFTVSLFNPVAASDLYMGTDFSAVHNSGFWKYVAIASFFIASPALKAYMFYLIIKLFSRLNLEQPFNERLGNLLVKVSHVALGIGLLAVISNAYAKSLLKGGIQFVYESDSSEFLFLAGIVFVIAQIFKRGLELQNESELTV